MVVLLVIASFAVMIAIEQLVALRRRHRVNSPAETEEARTLVPRTPHETQMMP
ncbi:MAG: hypothetical protein GXO78_03250 [Calditrichaeota bacterium]|nr:hypothetical protein [Calditrichota bacterium]